MYKKIITVFAAIICSIFLFAQNKKQGGKTYPDSIAPVGIIKGLSDDQLVMIENYRSGLLWKLFMKIPDMQNGLKKLGFKSPYLEAK